MYAYCLCPFSSLSYCDDIHVCVDSRDKTRKTKVVLVACMFMLLLFLSLSIFHQCRKEKKVPWPFHSTPISPLSSLFFSTPPPTAPWSSFSWFSDVVVSLFYFFSVNLLPPSVASFASALLPLFHHCSALFFLLPDRPERYKNDNKKPATDFLSTTVTIQIEEEKTQNITTCKKRLTGYPLLLLPFALFSLFNRPMNRCSQSRSTQPAWKKIKWDEVHSNNSFRANKNLVFFCWPLCPSIHPPSPSSAEPIPVNGWPNFIRTDPASFTFTPLPVLSLQDRLPACRRNQGTLSICNSNPPPLPLSLKQQPNNNDNNNREKRSNLTKDQSS